MQDTRLMFKRIKHYLTRPLGQTKRKDLEILVDNQRVSDTHLVALARLMFIKPADLVREAKNHKANGEYLLKMIEIRDEARNKNETT